MKTQHNDKKSADKDLVYGDPYSITLTKGEKWSNFWNRKIAQVKGSERYTQIGLLPTGEKGEFTIVKGDCVLHE